MRWTTFVRSMQPRDYVAAARVLSVLYLVAGSVTVLGSLVQLIGDELSRTEALIAVLVGLVVVVAGVFTRIAHDGHRTAWAVAPLIAVGVIVVLDLLTRDASVSAQVFLFFPVLYAASQLRRNGAVVLTAASVVGELLVVFLQLGALEAVVSATYVVAVMVTVAALLIRAGHAQEILVARLERQAAIDSLTGLVTRRVLDEAAQSALSGAASDEGTALILLDLDNFKTINDVHGHPGGDGVLVQMSALLTARSRRTDIVSRLGGDEIALLLPGCSTAAACERAEQILADVRTHAFHAPDGTSIAVSVSMGVAHAPTHATDLRSLYASADGALYASKRSGRDQLQVAQDKPNDRSSGGFPR